ncbi:helix-turn-helix domain-containing protein [Flavobacterium procerum]|uniref:Helix-turn-helix domain-containing protein n=1 Tax=Flavobacterium procerum TaxID=1455569 RepID=A0ABV6BS21_9FLAO
MLIGDKVKSIRELKNYTQQYIACELGITQPAYSKIEKGKTRISMVKLEQLAIILELPLQDIINFEMHRDFNDDMNCENGSHTGSFIGYSLLKKLYEDKIELLEKFVSKTNNELQIYRKKFGPL